MLRCSWDTSRVPSTSRPKRTRAPLCPRWLAVVLGASLLGVSVLGCGGQSGSLNSTDTGNPPVIIGQKLRLVPSATGVVVLGEPGAVPPGAQVEVANLSTGRSERTTAANDGAFEVELEGTLDDDYRVQVSVGGRSSSTVLTAPPADTPDAPNPPDAEPNLAGREFLLESAEGYTPVDGTLIRLSFGETDLRFDAGCNGHFGSYSLCEGNLCVSDLGSTLMGCSEERQAQDDWFAAFLNASPTVIQTAIPGSAAPAPQRLSLVGAEATLELVDRESASFDWPLVSRTWIVDTLIDGGTASTLELQSPPMLTFEAGDRVVVFTSCNTGVGTYTVDGPSITLSTLDYTEEGCDPRGSADVEAHLEQVFSAGTVTFDMDVARLTIFRGTLGVSATTR
jgi:heat shock protein HslJ